MIMGQGTNDHIYNESFTITQGRMMNGCLHKRALHGLCEGHLGIWIDCDDLQWDQTTHDPQCCKTTPWTSSQTCALLKFCFLQMQNIKVFISCSFIYFAQTVNIRVWWQTEKKTTNAKPPSERKYASVITWKKCSSRNDKKGNCLVLQLVLKCWI